MPETTLGGLAIPSRWIRNTQAKDPPGIDKEAVKYRF